MSLGTLTSSTSDPAIRMRSKPDIPSDLVIRKPSTIAGRCPLEKESKRFPRIAEAPRKKKPKKKSASTTDSLEFWLKPGISLPKLHLESDPREKAKPREFYSRVSYSSTPRKKSESELGELFSSHSGKCLLSKSESCEIASNVCGPSQCQLLFSVPSSELNLDKLQAEEEILEEDHALMNWRKWTQEHKRQQKHLSERLGKPFNLLLQRTDLYRQTLENKLLLATGEIPQADKWRGHPYHWNLPIHMKKKKGKITKIPEEDFSSAYVLQKTQAQEGIVEDLEFIGTPDVIKKEKGFKSNTRCHFALIKSNQTVGDAAAVVEERIKNFMKLRHRIKPPTENFSQMAVLGTKVPRTPEVVPPEPPAAIDVPTIKVTAPDNKFFCQDTRPSVFCLVINDVEIKYELGQEPQDENEGSWECTWELDFGISELGKRVEKTLRVENKGTTAVRYEWVSRSLELKQKFNALTPKQHEPWFFFNKNPGIFLPGQFYNLKFYYHARKSGVRTETWFLKTIPPLNKNTRFGTIVLSAVASGDFHDRESHLLEEYLRGRLRESVVKFILGIILEKVARSDENLRELEYQSLFSDKELFEYHNPLHYYHSDLVNELNELFKKIPFKIQKTWDMSLDSLKKLISITTKGKDREYLLCNLNSAAKKLLKPIHVFARKEKKYRMAYSILCKMTNSLEADYNHIRSILSGKKREDEKWRFGEYEETVNSSSVASEEKCDLDSGSLGSLRQVTPVNLIYFQTMFYIKVYHRVSEAVENIVGMLESSKRFESLGSTNNKASKPPSRKREFDFFPCL